jgi:hypothetical protein
VARGFEPLTDEATRELLARTARAARGGEFEPYKTTTRFDDTYHHPEWMGEST